MSQQITITLNFKVNHSSGSPGHLQQIAQNYFKGKGVVLSDNNSIEI